MNDMNVYKIGRGLCRTDINNLIISLIIFILNPFLGCLLGLYFLSHKKLIKTSFILIVSFAALYGYTILPYSNDDIVRHYGFFESISQINSLSALFIYLGLTNHPDFGIDLLYWFVGRFTVNHQVVGAIGAALYYGFVLLILYKWLKSFSNINFTKSFVITSFALLALIPSNEFCGMRQGVANAIFIFLILYLSEKKKDSPKSLLYLLIPCIIHFSIIPYLILFLLCLKFDVKKIIILTAIMAVSGMFIMPLMQVLIGIISKLGFIGAGIAIKIDGYMFSGELENELYSGSRLRFYLLLFFVIIYPMLLRKIYKGGICENGIKPVIFRFFILFYGYLVLTSQTFILSRTLMLFKIILCLSLSLMAFCSVYSPKINARFKKVLILIGLAGFVFLLQALEYRVINIQLFTSSLPKILSIVTDPAGYPI